ncbi:hypothetical protein LY78DRAFT_204767 [Colletotrichum sublineola]|nr:hypothetical protein LY78DRAFT_204767 [Colletotrichum sublineola]
MRSMRFSIPALRSDRRNNPSTRPIVPDASLTTTGKGMGPSHHFAVGFRNFFFGTWTASTGVDCKLLPICAFPIRTRPRLVSSRASSDEPRHHPCVSVRACCGWRMADGGWRQVTSTAKDYGCCHSRLSRRVSRHGNSRPRSGALVAPGESSSRENKQRTQQI